MVFVGVLMGNEYRQVACGQSLYVEDVGVLVRIVLVYSSPRNYEVVADRQK
jgi:hypothetical protein